MPDQQFPTPLIDVIASKSWARTLVAGLTIVALCTVTGRAIASGYAPAILALTAATIVAVFAWTRPELFGVAVVAMLLFPYTWSPTLRTGQTPVIVLFAVPGALAGAAALLLNGKLRLSILDYLVAASFIALLLSESVTGGGGIFDARSLSHYEGQAIVLPYLAFRLIFAAWPHVISRLPGALLITGAALSLFAVYEELRGSTPFATSSLNNPQLAVWEKNYPRAGGVRAEATLGHPIALGSFLVIPLVFAFAQRRWRLFALLALGEALTLSRGPYIAAIATLVLYCVLTARVSRIAALLMVMGALALFVGPVRGAVTNSFQTGTSEQVNGDYRARLLSTSVESLTFWGNPSREFTQLYSDSQGRLTDVTSEFAGVAGLQGVPGLLIWIGFLAAFAYVVREGRRRRDSILLLLGVALIGEWIALLSVALITSFGVAFWLTVASAATRLSQRPGPNANALTSP